MNQVDGLLRFLNAKGVHFFNMKNYMSKGGIRISEMTRWGVAKNVGNHCSTHMSSNGQTHKYAHTLIYISII